MCRRRRVYSFSTRSALSPFSSFFQPSLGSHAEVELQWLTVGGNQSRMLGSGREEDKKTAPVAHPRPSPSCLSLLVPLKAGDEFGFRQH